MGLVLVVLAVAAAAGLALGGRLRAPALPSPGLLLAALLAQLLGAVGGGVLAPVGLAVSAALVGVVLLRSRGVRGTGLVALGLLANVLVVAANGAMPVSAHAAARAGAAVPVDDGRHEIADLGTRLRLLADVVPVPLPLRPEVDSAGDVAVAAGLGQLLLAALLAGRAPRDSAPAGGRRARTTLDRPPRSPAGRPGADLRPASRRRRVTVASAADPRPVVADTPGRSPESACRCAAALDTPLDPPRGEDQPG